jgi:hypothetical protein
VCVSIYIYTTAGYYDNHMKRMIVSVQRGKLLVELASLAAESPYVNYEQLSIERNEIHRFVKRINVIYLVQ